MANRVAVIEHFQTTDDTPTHYIKRRVSNRLIADGYAKRISRWLIQMIRYKYEYALRIIVDDGMGQLKPEGAPECTVYSYPVRERTSNAKPFGFYQDWSLFPCHE